MGHQLCKLLGSLSVYQQRSLLKAGVGKHSLCRPWQPGLGKDLSVPTMSVVGRESPAS